MAHIKPVVVLIIASYLSCVAYGKSEGALPQSCLTMVPGHTGTSGQTGPSPFSLTVDKTKYQKGDKVMVTLSKTSTNQFKGYFIQARDENDNIIPGFKVANEGKYLTCSSTNDAVTHTEPSSKDSVSFEFTASSPGKITMYATAVQTYDTYWVKIPSQTIEVVAGSGSKTLVVSTFVLFVSACFYILL